MIYQLSTQLDTTVQTVRFLTDPATRQIALQGTEENPGAAGKLFWDPTERRLRFVAAGLTPPELGRTYQLWFITDADQPVSLGVFDVDADGRVYYDADVSDLGAAVKLAAVSLEPAGGVPQPTGAIQMAGEAGQ